LCSASAHNLQNKRPGEMTRRYRQASRPAVHLVPEGAREIFEPKHGQGCDQSDCGAGA
jgi:hypothetical protein